MAKKYYGTEGQDRKCYSGTQDRESYRVMDIEPKWVTLTPYFIRMVRGENAENRKVAEEHIMQMAEVMDWVRQAQKRGVKMLRIPSEKKLRSVM